MANFYDYIPGSSTTNIIYSDEGNGILHCLNWRPTRPIGPLLETLHPSPTLLSSSRGLIVCRNFLSDYFICNPFISVPEISYTILPNPPRDHPPHSTHVVLATDFPLDATGRPAPVFDVICAIERIDNLYDFDIYSSNTGGWFHALEGFNLGCRIVPDSGISCGRCAYWLTVMPRKVLKYNILGNTIMEIISFIQMPNHLLNTPCETWRFQLGRIGNWPGITIADEALSSVQVSILQGTQNVGQYRWHNIGFLHMIRRPDVCWDGTVNENMGQWTIVCRELPRAIRFESFKMEVLFWVDGQVVLLESFNENPIVGGNRVSALPYYNVPACVDHGLPLIHTYLHPGSFILNQQ